MHGQRIDELQRRVADLEAERDVETAFDRKWAQEAQNIDQQLKWCVHQIQKANDRISELEAQVAKLSSAGFCTKADVAEILGQVSEGDDGKPMMRLAEDPDA